MYYLRTKPAANAIQFTVDMEKIKQVKQNQTISREAEKEQKSEEYQEQAMACSLQNKEACVMCSA